ncbi:TAP42-like family protein [Ancylostoma duodenale]|uniref:TAP42-like family protein n=1 Tax=Ancylostoma duodenale TaxID=51022 RepID=A0A0C2DEW4_9BILA|nr:TAP42-like family protein [Ancylostoma duodenale]
MRTCRSCSVNPLLCFETVEDIPTSSLPYLLIPCYLGVAQHNTSTTDPVHRREQLRLAKIYYMDFLRRLRNYGFEFDGSLLENEDSLPDTPQPSVKKFTGEEVREQKIARFRRQKELKQTMEELRRQQQLNNGDESTLRELHLTLIKYWIEKVLEELNSIEEPLKPFIITRSEQQKAVFGLGYPSIPTMTVDEWYNQRFGGNAAPSHAPQKPGCSEGHAGNSCEEEHEREEDEDEKRARLMRWDEYKDDHRRGWGNTHNKG